MATREYLRAPHEKFFFPSPRESCSEEVLRDKAGQRLDNLISVEFPKLDLIDDVVYPQLRKSLINMTALLERADFEVEKTTIHMDDSTHLLIELSSISLPKEKKHRGPPVNSENVNDFMSKWNSLGVSAPYIEDGRWWVMVKRDFQRADDILKAKIGSVPLGKDVKRQGKFSISSGKDLLQVMHLSALTHHFDERMPWQR